MKKNMWIYLGVIIILITIIFLILKFTKKKEEFKNISENSLSNNEKNVNEELLQETEKVIPAEYIEKLEDGTLKNSSEKLEEVKEIDKIKLYNIEMTAKDNETIMTIDLLNTTNYTKEEKEITLVLKDKEGEELGEVGLPISKMEAGEGLTMEIELDLKLINTYSIEIKDEPLTLE